MSLNRTHILPLLVLVLLAAMLGWALLWQPGGNSHSDTGQPNGGDFTLQSAKGNVTLSDYRGKVVLLYFGYTSCPDICPTSLTLMRIALSQLTEEELKKVQGIFISVDPQRDTPERLAQYSSHFHENIIGLTGNDADIARAARQYGAIYQRAESDSALGYTVDHSSVTYVIDQQGRLNATLPHGAPPESILQAVRSLLGG